MKKKVNPKIFKYHVHAVKLMPRNSLPESWEKIIKACCEEDSISKFIKETVTPMSWRLEVRKKEPCIYQMFVKNNNDCLLFIDEITTVRM